MEQTETTKDPEYMTMRVYMCAPVASNPTTGTREENLALLKRLHTAVIRFGAYGQVNFIQLPNTVERVPVTLQPIDSPEDTVDDSIEARLALLETCHEVWVFGLYLTDHMAEEIAFARANDIQVNFVVSPLISMEYEVFSFQTPTPQLMGVEKKRIQPLPPLDKIMQNNNTNMIEDICYAYEESTVKKSDYINPALTEEAFLENVRTFVELFQEFNRTCHVFARINRFLAFDREMIVDDALYLTMLTSRIDLLDLLAEGRNLVFYIVRVFFQHPDYQEITLKVPQHTKDHFKSIYDYLYNKVGSICYDSQALLDRIIVSVDEAYDLKLEGVLPHRTKLPVEPVPVKPKTKRRT